MVWGVKSVCSRRELLVVNRILTGHWYINEVVQPVVLPFVQQHHVVLQDNNAIPIRRGLWIISISLLDPLTCRQSSMFGTF